MTDGWNNGIKIIKPRNWLDDFHETILVFGLPKHGKTYAYCSYIDYVLQKGGKVYIISTDSGFIRTAKTYWGNRINDIKDRIFVEPVYDINSIRSYYKSILPELNDNDVIVIDLVSDVWEWAQISFVESFGDDIQSFIVNAMRDTAKFGLFDSNKWNYVKALHKFVEDIIVRKPCNFVGVCGEKDTDVEIKRGGKETKELLKHLGFDEISVRSDGYKKLPYKFETVIRISVDNNGYFMQIVGDRGQKFDLTKQYYGTKMFKKLLEWRRENGKKCHL